MEKQIGEATSMCLSQADEETLPAKFDYLDRRLGTVRDVKKVLEATDDAQPDGASVRARRIAVGAAFVAAFFVLVLVSLISETVFGVVLRGYWILNLLGGVYGYWVFLRPRRSWHRGGLEVCRQNCSWRSGVHLLSREPPLWMNSDDDSPCATRSECGDVTLNAVT